MDKFTVTKDEYTNRTLLFEVGLWDRISAAAQKSNVSANALIVQAVTYALERMDEDSKRKD